MEKIRNSHGLSIRQESVASQLAWLSIYKVIIIFRESGSNSYSPLRLSAIPLNAIKFSNENVKSGEVFLRIRMHDLRATDTIIYQHSKPVVLLRNDFIADGQRQSHSTTFSALYRQKRDEHAVLSRLPPSSLPATNRGYFLTIDYCRSFVSG